MSKKAYCPSGPLCTRYEETCAHTGCQRRLVEEMVQRSCREQNLPEKIIDPEVIRQVLTLLTGRAS